MEIVVRGKNRPVSQHLRAVTSRKAARIARVAYDAGRVEVEFSEVRNPREPRPQECEMTVHLARAGWSRRTRPRVSRRRRSTSCSTRSSGASPESRTSA